MSILDPRPPLPDAPFTVTIAEHRSASIRRFRPPGRVIWFTIRPCRHFRVEVLHGYKDVVAAVVSIGF